MQLVWQSAAGRILPAHTEGTKSCKCPSTMESQCNAKESALGRVLHSWRLQHLPSVPSARALVDNLHVLPAGEIDLCPVSERCLMIVQVNFQMSLWYLSERKMNGGFAIFNWVLWEICFSGGSRQCRNVCQQLWPHWCHWPDREWLLLVTWLSICWSFSLCKKQ